MVSQFSDLKTVLTSSFSHEIYIAKSLLENQGISCFVFDDNLNNIIGTAFVEGYKLKVNSLDFEQAEAVLKALNS